MAVPRFALGTSPGKNDNICAEICLACVQSMHPCTLVRMTTAISQSVGRVECVILKAAVTAVNSDVLLYDPTGHRSAQCSLQVVCLSAAVKYHIWLVRPMQVAPVESASDPASDVDIGRSGLLLSGASLQHFRRDHLSPCIHRNLTQTSRTVRDCTASLCPCSFTSFSYLENTF